MDVITLMDNLVYGEQLTGEHGLCFLIKYHGNKILFDTGQTGAILHNAGTLGEDLSDVDAVVISQGYDDHFGGLHAFLMVNSHATIYLKPAVASAANTPLLKKAISEYPNTFVWIEEDMEIFPGVWAIAQINTYSNLLGSKESYFVKLDHSPIFDPFADELFLLIDDGKRNHVITGCSHIGIFNILKTAYEKGKHKKIHTLCGGMYFNGNLLDRLDQYLDEINVFGIEKMYVNHCTGIDGYLRLKNKFPSHVTYAFTGYQFEIV